MYEKSILITGGAGFIGSHFIINFLKKYSGYKVINLDKLTYASDLNNLSHISHLKNYSFVKGDVCDRDLLRNLFERYNIKGVVNFAAESHVDNSISNPSIFVKTNIDGTLNLLETARCFWMEKPGVFRNGYSDSKFHHISTDEVYGSLGKTGLFSEETPYAPNSPYSASKASSDFLVRSYHHTFGMNTTISNCSNNYGPHQHEEKLIPVVIKNALQLKPIPIYGKGNNIRDWLHVEDHCNAIDLIYHNGQSGHTYNIGGHNELTNLEVLEEICSKLDIISPRKDGKKYSDLKTFVKDRPGHDQRYAIDPTKIERELFWKAEKTFNNSIESTISWYIKKWAHHTEDNMI